MRENMPTIPCSSPRHAASELRTPLDEMPARIASLMEERKRLERDLSDARKKLAMGGGAAASNGSAAAGPRAFAKSATSS